MKKGADAIKERQAIDFMPYYEGFKGSIIRLTGKDSGKYLFKGVFKIISSCAIQITELPIGTWTTDYKAF